MQGDFGPGERWYLKTTIYKFEVVGSYRGSHNALSQVMRMICFMSIKVEADPSKNNFVGDCVLFYLSVATQ